MRVSPGASAGYAELLDRSPDASLVLDEHGTILYANPASTAMFERTALELVGERFGEPVPASGRADVELMTGDGVRVVEMTAVEVPWGTRSATVAVLRDVTDARHSLAMLAESESRFRAAFEDAGVAIAVAPLEETAPIMEANPALCRLTGQAGAELTTRSLHSLIHPDDLPEVRRQVGRLLARESSVLASEVRLLASEGVPVWVEMTSSLVVDELDEPLYRLVHMQDVSARKLFEGRLRHLADHDPLTGLFNRRRFEVELAREVTAAARYPSEGALLLLDLDNFKLVNDTLGHAAGDELMRWVASVIVARLRDSDCLARIGGDEFAVILPHADREAALIVANNLRKAIRGSDRHGRAHGTTASIGIALFGDRSKGLSGETLLVEADMAMYDSKRRGRDCVTVFKHQRHRAVPTAGTAWAKRIRTALDDGRLELHAQPIVTIASRRELSQEFLLRLVDRGEVVLPHSFLGPAEQLDLIQEIDRWVVSESVRLAARERVEHPDACFAFNVSAKSIGDPGFIGHVERELASAKLDPAALIVELSNPQAIIGLDAAQAFSTRLRELGCGISLDDVGSAYDSFSQLTQLDFDYLKIDGGFIQEITADRSSRLVVEAIVLIARGLGKQTVAESVLDEATMRLLEQIGVDHAQGFGVGRPRPLAGGSTS